MFGTRGRFALIGAVMALALIAAACASSSAATGGGSTFRITAPATGESVTEPFTVRIDSSAALGDPFSGDDHVHVCFDGQSCDQERNLVFGTSCTVTDLAPGRHTIEASLRNADHSAAGPNDTITVMVAAGSAAGTGQGSCGTTPTAGRTSGGYGY
jgi:hypothetical protein